MCRYEAADCVGQIDGIGVVLDGASPIPIPDTAGNIDPSRRKQRYTVELDTDTPVPVTAIGFSGNFLLNELTVYYSK